MPILDPLPCLFDHKTKDLGVSHDDWGKVRR